MGARFLIDTNAAIDLLNNRLPPPAAEWLERAIAEKRCVLSTINRIELLSGPSSVSDAGRQLLHTLIDELPELVIDEAVVLETIRIRQTHRRKLPDAIIAATALAHGLAVVTRNVADFRAIPGLTVLDPHDSAALPAL